VGTTWRKSPNAAAKLDRSLHHSVTLVIQGESYRVGSNLCRTEESSLALPATFPLASEAALIDGSRNALALTGGAET
jgi:hypothetical protein